MVTLENQIETILAEIVDQRTAHPETDELIKRAHAIAKDQHTALSARIQSIRSEISDPTIPDSVPPMAPEDARTATTSNPSRLKMLR